MKKDLQHTTEIDTKGIALIFEGGGMRNAYTAPVVKTLLENGIEFPKVYGISAGSVLAACYIAHDPRKAEATFVDSVKLRGAGGFFSFIKGNGFFDTRYIFEEITRANAGKNDEWSFDFDAFSKNPSDIHIEAFARNSGHTVAWTKKDMQCTHDVMVRVAASCSYPLFTPPITVNNVVYVDGGMGSSHGICLDAAIRDGFDRFFIVRTQPREYRMPELDRRKRIAYRIAYRKYPHVFEALVKRPAEYNALLDRIEELRCQGKAYVFCPDTMPITYMTTEYSMLRNAYEMGRKQSLDELASWISWINES